MSQHWDDRDDEDLRAYLLVSFGADPRDVKRGATYGWEVAVGVAIGLALGAALIDGVMTWLGA
jgi:hypothetical protein